VTTRPSFCCHIVAAVTVIAVFVVVGVIFAVLKWPQRCIADASRFTETQEVIVDPVLSADGFTYERELCLISLLNSNSLESLN
jgi:hypothetical protein